MKRFTVIGIYLDNEQRWASCVEADTPQEAEQQAHLEAEPGLLIAGVIAGDHPLVDSAS